MASKKQSPAAGCVVLLFILAAIIGGISSCINGGSASTSNTPDYSTYVPDDPATPDPGFTDDGTDDSGGSVDLPDNGYVRGPGVGCGLSGCHVDVLPHAGFHF
jgi:hypothetical protein